MVMYKSQPDSFCLALTAGLEAVQLCPGTCSRCDTEQCKSKYAVLAAHTPALCINALEMAHLSSHAKQKQVLDRAMYMPQHETRYGTSYGSPASIEGLRNSHYGGSHCGCAGSGLIPGESSVAAESSSFKKLSAAMWLLGKE